MPKVKLDARNVFTRKAGPGGARRSHSDTVLRGFELRVSGGVGGVPAVRSFRVRYSINGADRSVTIGSAYLMAVSDARDKAREILGRVAAGEDPAGEKSQARKIKAENADTFEALGRRLVKEADLADSTRASWTWLLEKRIFPAIGTRPPAGITRGELRDFLAKIMERSGSQANECLRLTSWVLARAVDRELIPANPAAGIRRLAKERIRDRVLTPVELRALWTAAGNAGAYGCAVKMGHLTAIVSGKASEKVVSFPG